MILGDNSIKVVRSDNNKTVLSSNNFEVTAFAEKTASLI